MAQKVGGGPGWAGFLLLLPHQLAEGRPRPPAGGVHGAPENWTELCEHLPLVVEWGRVRGEVPQDGHSGDHSRLLPLPPSWSCFLNRRIFLSSLVVAFLNLTEVLFHDGSLKGLCAKGSIHVPGFSGWPRWADVPEMCLTVCCLTLSPPQERSTHPLHVPQLPESELQLPPLL